MILDASYFSNHKWHNLFPHLLSSHVGFPSHYRAPLVTCTSGIWTDSLQVILHQKQFKTLNQEIHKAHDGIFTRWAFKTSRIYNSFSTPVFYNYFLFDSTLKVWSVQPEKQSKGIIYLLPTYMTMKSESTLGFLIFYSDIKGYSFSFINHKRLPLTVEGSELTNTFFYF